MALPVVQRAGVLENGSGSSVYGQIIGGASYNSLGRSRIVCVDTGLTSPDSSSISRHDESYTLSSPTANEVGVNVLAAASAAGGGATSWFKNAVQGAVVASAISNFGTTAFQHNAVVGSAVSSTNNTQALMNGVVGQAIVSPTSDATASALQALLVNTGGTAVGTVNTARSKYALQLMSAGAAKNTAFCYASKQAYTSAPAVNCSHGVLVDSASVDANALAVVSGTTPTVIYGVQPSGKVTYSAADQVIATQAATAALTSASGLVTITALTLAAATSITVACTTAAGLAVTSASRIELTIQNQTGAAAGFVVASADSVAANAFNIRLTNTAAATAYGGGAFSVFYRIFN